MTRIGNRYLLQEVLGTGGMGVVYRAQDTQTGEVLAIKQLKADQCTPELLERFQREGEILRALNHPNIVKTYGTLREHDTHYLLMEYVAGGDLRALMHQGLLPVEQILQIALDLADALTRAHRLNIVHRDIKPANILLAVDDTPRLTDFGVAHMVNQSPVTENGIVVGTPDYLAPEVLRGEDPEPGTDIWAFGVLLFEMLAGQRPFGGETLSQTIYNILSLPVPDLEALRPDAPVDLVDLIYRMLTRDKQMRIASVRLVGAALEDILHGRSSTRKLNEPEKHFQTSVSAAVHRQKHNLPNQTTPFVGREMEVAEIMRLIDSPNSRLVTILAPGGMGKTRLSLEIASRYVSFVAEDSPTHLLFQDGVYFVELAPLSSAELIIRAIAEAIGFTFQQDGRSAHTQLTEYLQNRHVLLVLDNFEHLLAGGIFITQILQQSAYVKMLVTSRQRLNQTGEAIFNLEGMELPEAQQHAHALNYASIQLFHYSALRVNPRFELNEAILPDVVRICRAVYGVPLGIVLAASWLTLLTPREIADEIQQNIDFLDTEMSDVPERQRSLRAVFDYSWNLMNAEEQAIFVKSSIFKGGFTREAVSAIAGASLKTLLALVNKSLIWRDPQSGRYTIHELLRQYAEEKLLGLPDYPALSRAYAQYFVEIISNRWKGDFTTLEDYHAIYAENENARSAYRYCVAHGMHREVEKIIAPVARTLHFLGYTQEATDLLTAGIDAFRKQPALPETIYLLGVLYTIQSAIDMAFDIYLADEHADQAIACLEQHNLGYYLTDAYYNKAYLLNAMFRSAEALPYVEKILTLSQQLGYDRGSALAQLIYTHTYLKLGEFEQAFHHAQIALASAPQYSSPALWILYDMLGNIEMERGNFDNALKYAHLGYEEAKKSQQLYTISFQIHSLAQHYARQGDDRQALRYLRESLDWHQRLGEQWQTMGAVQYMVSLHWGLFMSVDEAIQVLSMVYHHPESIPVYRRNIERAALDGLKTTMDDARFEQLWQTGQSLDFQDVLQRVIRKIEAKIAEA